MPVVIEHMLDNEPLLDRHEKSSEVHDQLSKADVQT